MTSSSCWDKSTFLLYSPFALIPGVHKENVNSFLRWLSKSVTFLDLEFHKVVQQHIGGEVETFVYVHREFSYESPGERILKIGPHLPKLLSNSKWDTLFGT